MNTMLSNEDYYNCDRIKEIRKRTGLTQIEFARLYDIPVATYRNWEQKRTVMPDYVFELLHRSVTIDEETICKCLLEEETLIDGWKEFYNSYIMNQKY